MKKLVVATAALAIMAGSAFAWGPMGQGYGKPGFAQGYGQGCGKGMMMGYGAGYGRGINGQNVEKNILSETDAKKAIEEFMKNNLKGFSIEKIEKFQVPRGTAYYATVTDKKNSFQIHVNPWGNVVGPFPIQK
ncbi:MAG: PepSY domain-containing protein [Calditerrivibrio sp.]|nr:PepSY domain-containing protein [Calditerrivibrio sp.]MCA1933047.1 PepSY domain-containing protein [Calditerrivibrio sp.]MCA1980926.1 PepSY domain-containing protein [Calditerrivibrio sp.]